MKNINEVINNGTLLDNCKLLVKLLIDDFLGD